MVTLGISNEYLIVNFTRTGEDGIMIGIGKDMKAGVLETINLNQNNKCSNKDSRDNSSINRDLTFSNINNRDSSNKDNPRFRNLKVNNKDNLRFSSRKDNSKSLRFSNHNTLSLKENLKEGRKNIKGRMTTSLKKLPSIISARTARDVVPIIPLLHPLRFRGMESWCC